MKAFAPGDALPGEERSFFLECRGEAVAVVSHAPAPGRARATVVLAGPMTLERSHGHLTWVRWARTLAANGYRVLRFDYGGVGESSGDFGQQTFDGWAEDLACVCAFARAQAKAGQRVVALGLRLGALLGRRVFDAFGCDGFVAWDPPAGGRPMLMDMLRRKLAADYMELAGERKTRDAYVQQLEAGEAVEVEGYPWSRGLWASAEAWSWGPPERLAGEHFSLYLDGRPAARLPDPAYCASVKLPRPAFWLQSATLVPDMSELFGQTLARLDAFSDGWSVAPPSEAAPTGDAPRAVEQARGRALSTVDLPAGRCVGTAQLPVQRRGKVGLLWVNFGYVPRDGHGGLAVLASEALAAQGVPCFRYDLPGLGDAPGELPAHLSAFVPRLTDGAFTPVTRQLVRHLCETHGLAGLVVAGLCGGAINALFTADEAPDLVRGVVLLEPELYLTEPSAADAGGEAPGARDWLRARLPESRGPLWGLVDQALAARPAWEAPLRQAVEARLPVQHLRARLFSYWGWMRLLTHENAYARYVPLPRKALLDLVLGGSKLPSVTNVPLASAWQRWVSRGRPALVITAKGKLREVFFDRIAAVVLAGVDQRSFQHLRLPHTNHIFTSGGAIARVTRALAEAWPALAGEPRLPTARGAAS